VILHLALLQEAPAEPPTERPRSPHVPNRNGRRARARVQAKERPPPFPLASLHPTERTGRGEIDDLEFGLARAEARREPSALPEGAGALDAVASREPLRDTRRVGEQREHPVDWSADRIDEGVTDGPHRLR